MLKRNLIYLLLSSPFLVQAQYSENEPIVPTDPLLRNHDLLVPASFRDAYSKQNIIKHKELFHPNLLDTLPGAQQIEVLVPSQFLINKIISVQEQQRKLDEEASESIYKDQSDPAYFEKKKQAFKEEYLRRMKAKYSKR